MCFYAPRVCKNELSLHGFDAAQVINNSAPAAFAKSFKYYLHLKKNLLSKFYFANLISPFARILRVVQNSV
jgi:hypothetical protein